MAQESVDSANTGILEPFGSAQSRCGSGVSPKATGGMTNSAGPVFINPAAFTFPPANPRRVGDSSVGSVAGPGTDSVSLSLIKSIKLTERLQFQFGAQAANAFNHEFRCAGYRRWTISRLVRFPGCRARKGRVHGTWRSRGGSVSRGRGRRVGMRTESGHCRPSDSLGMTNLRVVPCIGIGYCDANATQRLTVLGFFSRPRGTHGTRAREFRRFKRLMERGRGWFGLSLFILRWRLRLEAGWAAAEGLRVCRAGGCGLCRCARRPT